MPRNALDRSQELTVRVSALHSLTQECLTELASLYGDDAERKLRLLRNKLVRKYKQSDIPADREMQHAQIVGPAISAIELAFEDFLPKSKPE